MRPDLHGIVNSLRNLTYDLEIRQVDGVFIANMLLHHLRRNADIRQFFHRDIYHFYRDIGIKGHAIGERCCDAQLNASGRTCEFVSKESRAVSVIRNITQIEVGQFGLIVADNSEIPLDRLAFSQIVYLAVQPEVSNEVSGFLVRIDDDLVKGLVMVNGAGSNKYCNLCSLASAAKGHTGIITIHTGLVEGYGTGRPIFIPFDASLLLRQVDPDIHQVVHTLRKLALNTEVGHIDDMFFAHIQTDHPVGNSGLGQVFIRNIDYFHREVDVKAHITGEGRRCAQIHNTGFAGEVIGAKLHAGAVIRGIFEVETCHVRLLVVDGRNIPADHFAFSRSVDFRVHFKDTGKAAVLFAAVYDQRSKDQIILDGAGIHTYGHTLAKLHAADVHGVFVAADTGLGKGNENASVILFFQRADIPQFICGELLVDGQTFGDFANGADVIGADGQGIANFEGKDIIRAGDTFGHSIAVINVGYLEFFLEMVTIRRIRLKDIGGSSFSAAEVVGTDTREATAVQNGIEEQLGITGGGFIRRLHRPHDFLAFGQFAVKHPHIAHPVAVLAVVDGHQAVDEGEFAAGRAFVSDLHRSCKLDATYSHPDHGDAVFIGVIHQGVGDAFSGLHDFKTLNTASVPLHKEVSRNFTVKQAGIIGDGIALAQLQGDGIIRQSQLRGEVFGHGDEGQHHFAGPALAGGGFSLHGYR